MATSQRKIKVTKSTRKIVIDIPAQSVAKKKTTTVKRKKTMTTSTKRRKTTKRRVKRK